MRGKRSKQYRRLMQQYGLGFGFREPYQVLLDADIIKDADRFKMDLVGGLERTLQGQVKPMITQCSMRHLYAAASEPGVSYLIDKAKIYERRRCGHLPSDYPEPLSAKACILSVVDPKSNGNNKHRYVVASQDLDVRKTMRGVLGVPLIYINRSVMIMEPMAGKTMEKREKEEKEKFRVTLKRGSGSLKRKRDEVDDQRNHTKDGGENTHKKKTTKGPKGPNPLAVKKPKKKLEIEGASSIKTQRRDKSAVGQSSMTHIKEPEANAKRKRRRKHKNADGDDVPVLAAAKENE